MDIIQLKKHMDEDEKKALSLRVNSLKEDYTDDDIERIVFSELDEIGLRSEYYVDLLDVVIKNIRSNETI